MKPRTDTEDNLDDLTKAERIQKASESSVKQTLEILKQSNQKADDSLNALNAQGEQIHNTRQNIPQINKNVKKGGRHIRGIRSFFGACANRCAARDFEEDELPAPVTPYEPIMQPPPPVEERVISEDEVIDDTLDAISDHVQRLKTTGQRIHTTVQQQNQELDGLQRDCEDAKIGVRKVNAQLRSL